MLSAGKQDLTMGCRVSQKIYILQALHISKIVPELIYLLNRKRISKDEKSKLEIKKLKLKFIRWNQLLTCCDTFDELVHDSHFLWLLIDVPCQLLEHFALVCMHTKLYRKNRYSACQQTSTNSR